jgi:hypothetical protein
MAVQETVMLTPGQGRRQPRLSLKSRWILLAEELTAPNEVRASHSNSMWATWHSTLLECWLHSVSSPMSPVVSRMRYLVARWEIARETDPGHPLGLLVDKEH